MMARAAALGTLALCPLFGQGTIPTFEVASIRPAEPDPRVTPCMCEPPGGIAYRLTPLRHIIRRAYNLQDLQIEGPNWLMDEKFDVDAKLPDGVSKRQLPAMLQTLLTERFKLSAHTTGKELRGFGLFVGKSGLKLKVAQSGGGFRSPTDQAGNFHLQGIMAMPVLVGFLSEQLGRPVLDETAFERRFTITLDFAPESPAQARVNSDILPAPPIATALEEQLGLKLESRTVSVSILMIDHIERVPTAN